MKNIFVCDTNIFISALLSKKSPPRQAINYIKSISGNLALSTETFNELAEVLQRPKFDNIISLENRSLFLRETLEVASLFDILEEVNICRDPKDNKFLDVAIASSADYLITGDEDLLVLESIKNTPIISPREFIDLLDID